MQYLYTLSPIIIMLVLFYLLIFVPENKRRKKYGQMLSDLKVNDEIITRGGIIGKIVNIQDNYIILQTGPDRAKIKFDKSGISGIYSKAEENSVEYTENN